MKTRIFLLVALIATVCITACSDQQVVEKKTGGQEISFRLQGGMPETATRALATTLANLEAFVVYGTDNEQAGLTPPKMLFDGITVARQKDGSFNYAPKVYYSENAALAGFFAIAPVSAPLTVNIPTNFLSGASFEYTVPIPDRTGDVVQVDLLVADTAVIPSTSGVSLDFDHALARIFVSAINETTEPVIIKELTLLNLKTTGKMDISLASLPPTPALAWDWDYTHLSALGNYPYILAESGVAVPSTLSLMSPFLLVTSEEQGMMVLPQETVNLGNDHTANDFALEIKYDFANLIGQTKHVYIPDGYEFEKGKQYNIIITFDEFLVIDFVIDVHPFDNSITSLINVP